MAPEEWIGADALEKPFATGHFTHAATVPGRILAEPMVIRHLVCDDLFHPASHVTGIPSGPAPPSPGRCGGGAPTPTG